MTLLHSSFDPGFSGAEAWPITLVAPCPILLDALVPSEVSSALVVFFVASIFFDSVFLLRELGSVLISSFINFFSSLVSVPRELVLPVMVSALVG